MLKDVVPLTRAPASEGSKKEDGQTALDGEACPYAPRRSIDAVQCMSIQCEWTPS